MTSLFACVLLFLAMSSDAYSPSRSIKTYTAAAAAVAPTTILSAAAGETASIEVSSAQTAKRSYHSLFKGLLTSASIATVVAVARPSASFADGDAAAEAIFIDALSVLMLSKQILAPSKQFIYVQAYDNARTNIRYPLNFLQLQKKLDALIQNSIDFSDDMDVIDAAQEASTKLSNTLLQYDNTVYTCIFIPSDDGAVPTTAEKYRKQAYDFYDSINLSIDTILKVGSKEQLAKATKLAEAAAVKLPKSLFKEKKDTKTPTEGYEKQ